MDNFGTLNDLQCKALTQPSSTAESSVSVTAIFWTIDYHHGICVYSIARSLHARLLKETSVFRANIDPDLLITKHLSPPLWMTRAWEEGYRTPKTSNNASFVVFGSLCVFGGLVVQLFLQRPHLCYIASFLLRIWRMMANSNRDEQGSSITSSMLLEP